MSTILHCKVQLDRSKQVNLHAICHPLCQFTQSVYCRENWNSPDKINILNLRYTYLGIICFRHFAKQALLAVNRDSRYRFQIRWHIIKHHQIRFCTILPCNFQSYDKHVCHYNEILQFVQWVWIDKCNSCKDNYICELTLVDGIQALFYTHKN